MKKSQFLLILFLFLRTFSTVLAQEAEFIDAKARFAIKASQKPIQEAVAFTLSKYEVNGTSDVWKDDLGNYVEVRNLQVFGEKPRLSQADKKTVLTTFKAGYLQDLQKAGLTIHEIPYVFDGFDGV